MELSETDLRDGPWDEDRRQSAGIRHVEPVSGNDSDLRVHLVRLGAIPVLVPAEEDLRELGLAVFSNMSLPWQRWLETACQLHSR
jgi:hypothetical protein